MSDQQRRRASTRSASQSDGQQIPANRSAAVDPMIEQFSREDFADLTESDEHGIEQRHHVLLWLALYDEAIRAVARWTQNTNRALKAFNPRRYDPENATFWINKFSAYRLIQIKGQSPLHFFVCIAVGDYPNEREVGISFDLGERGVFVRPSFYGSVDVSHIKQQPLCDPQHVQRFASDQIAAALRLFHTVVLRIPGPEERADRYNHSSKKAEPVEVLRGSRAKHPFRAARG